MANRQDWTVEAIVAPRFSGDGVAFLECAFAVDLPETETRLLPRLLARERGVVTIDAVGCQTAIATQITAQGADYVLARRDTLPTLRETVAVLFAAGPAHGFGTGHHDSRRTVEQWHGRIAVRPVGTGTDPAVLAERHPQGVWATLRRVGMVVAARRIGAQHARETREYLSRLPGDAASSGYAARPLGDRERPPLGAGYRLPRG